VTAPAASVLVPVLDEAAHIRASVGAMCAQELDEEYELLLLDGGSTDGTRELLAELARADGRIRLLDNPGRTVPCALNIGLRAARAPVVVRMDAHTIYPPHYLAAGLERLRRGDVAWVSGPQLPHGVDAGTRRVARALTTRLGTGGAVHRHAPGDEADAESGFTGLFDRALVERLGGWDEDWAANQDAELAVRLRAAGGRIVVLPALAASYVPRGSLRALARQYRRYGVYRAKTCARYPRSTRLRHVLPPAVVLTGVAAAAPLGPARGAARGLLAAYGAVLAATAAGATRDAPLREAAALPAVLATMHAAWGAGFLAGCGRFGVPALAAVLSRRRPAQAARRAGG
jgi:cellulose synthase/poly-beta-1,6-N-acetylglucosamine synthase-like glycosyltransferase